MDKYESFLAGNISKVQEYKKNGLDNAEKLEIQYGKELTKIFFQIENNLHSEENKLLFKDFFIQELNELYKDGLSPTEKKYLQGILNNILKNIKYLNSYEIETSFKEELEEIVKNKYKLALNEVEQDILCIEKNIDINNKLIHDFLKKIPYKRTNSIETDITLDKKWSILSTEDININLVNLVNFSIPGQIFIIENKGKQNIYIKYKNIAKNFDNISDLEVNYNENLFRISFISGKKKYIIFNREGKMYVIGINKKFYKQNTSYYKQKLLNYIALNKGINHDLQVYTKYIKLIKKNNPKQTTKPVETIKQEITSQKIKSKENKKQLETTKQKTTTEKIETSKKLSNLELSKLSTNERIKIIEKYLDSKEFEKYLDFSLSILEGKKTYLDIDSKVRCITFSKKVINKYKKQIIHNYKILLKMIIHIESDANPLARNRKGSSAIGLGQWLVSNGKYKISKYGKRFYATSSWETTLNNIWKNYPIKISEHISWFPEKRITKPYKVLPTDINWQDQIKILTLSLTKKDDNILIAALLGNSWGVKQLYKLYHTKPKKDTIQRIHKIGKNYTPKLINIYEKL